ncbi:S8 family serine peptidase [Gangjinia marincola]|uniref:S8 family serine peptidase n=1 Tax=Gangjinia marincola TaxID=578463 RepID=A0ABN1MFY7_9FLAO
MRSFTILFVLSITWFTHAQTQDAWVFFTDKEDVQASINNPISILTQEALDRKQLHNISIDERDVPVNETYIQQIKNASGINVLAKSKWMNCVYVQGTFSAIDNLLNQSFVSSIEYANKDLNAVTKILFSEENKFFQEENLSKTVYDYGDAANQILQLNAQTLHQEDYTGDGMVIAFLDSGFPNVQTIQAFSHLIDQNKLLGTYDFALRQEDVTGTGSHGTITLSDAAALLPGEFVGTAPQASYYLFRTEFAPTEVPVEEAWWVEALERADSLGVDVVNTSLGYQDYDNPAYDHSYEDLDGQTTFAARGANHAFDKGMLLVTSAGNDGNGFTFVGTPADSPGVMSIGAVDEDGNYASFSSIGPTVDGRIKPDVMAQGAGAAVINQDGTVSFVNGTSMSSPIMAGAIACLWQAYPQATNAQIMQILRESGSLFTTPSNEMGYGIPDFEAALAGLTQLNVQEALADLQFGIYPNPAQHELHIQFPANILNAEITILDQGGRKVMQHQLSPATSSMDLSRMASGLYLVTIKGNSTSNTFKLIKS